MKKIISILTLSLLLVSPVSGSAQNTNVCTGDPRQNISDALACAQIAKTEGQARGLNVNCQVSLATYPSTKPEEGSGYYYNIPCSVNGSTGNDAVLLAGYSGSALTTPNLSPTWYLFSNSSSQTNTTNTGSQTTTPGTNTAGQTSTATSGTSGGYGYGYVSIINSHVTTANNALSAINSGGYSYTLPTFTSPVIPPSNTNNTTVTNNTQSCGLTSELRIGDTGTGVLLLTTELVKEGLLSIPKSTFDAEVYNAVISYQEKYASSILHSVGLTRGSGFVGPSTLRFMNSRIKCSSTTPGSAGTTNGTNSATLSELQNQANNLQVLINSLLAQIAGGTTGTTGSTNTGNTSSNFSTPGTGSGNCTVLEPALSDSMKIAITARNPYTTSVDPIPVSGNKVAPNSGIYMMSPLVENYDGWAKVSVNGVDYPVAGPGTSCTSCQNHPSYGIFVITVPNLPVPDGSDLTVKLYKSNTSAAPYTVLKTFKYYSNPSSFISASSPLVMPHGSVNQSYNQAMTAKCGNGSISWIKPVIAGGLPKGYDIRSNSITYNPSIVEVKPLVGESYEWIVWGTSGSQDILQKFKLQIAQ